MKIKLRSTCWTIQHSNKGFLKGVNPWTLDLDWIGDIAHAYRFKTREEAEVYVKKMYRLKKIKRLSTLRPIKINMEKEEYKDRLPEKDWPLWRPSLIRDLNKLKKLRKDDAEMFLEIEEFRKVLEE